MQKRVALESTSPKVGTGFLHLMELISERKLPASADARAREKGLLKFIGAGKETDAPEVNVATLPIHPLPILVDNTMSIEDDPGPFKLATTQMVDAFSPVLVILPHSGVIDMVIVGLSPLDVYYRRKGLRLDDHSMTYLSALPSFDAMRRQGYSFQYFSPTKDYVSDSFVILRGGSNDIVAKTLDNRLPQDHSYVAQFKLLAYFGDYQENRDSGNAVGGTGKGYRIDLGACDHNYEGENVAGLAPIPRTNGGVKCFMESTGNKEIDSSQEKLRSYFGALMDAVQLIVDKVRQDHGYQRIYNDFTREKSFAGQLRDHVKAEHSRAEVSSNFVTLMDGNDGCCFHKDAKNCSTSSYDWTCCMAITVQSESSTSSYDWTCCMAITVQSETMKRLYRAVTNLNSRGHLRPPLFQLQCC
jgi:hypothetical protein